MPAITTSHRNLDPVASLATISGYINDTTTSISSLSGLELYPPDSEGWSIPVIVGVILTILAVVVGLPSAVLALQEIRRRQRARAYINKAKLENAPRSTHSNTGNDANVPTSSFGTNGWADFESGIFWEEKGLDDTPRCLLRCPFSSERLQLQRRYYMWRQPRLRVRSAFRRTSQDCVLRSIKRTRRPLLSVRWGSVQNPYYCGRCSCFARLRAARNSIAHVGGVGSS